MAQLIEVNLLPIEHRVVKKDYSYVSDSRVVYSVLAMLLTSIFIWGHYGLKKAEVSSTQDRIEELKADITRYDTVKTQIKSLEELKTQQESKNQSLRSISVSKKRWVRILEDLNASLPPHAWLVSIKEEEGDKVALVGRTYVLQEVGGFMLQLEKRPFFLTPSLESVEKVKDGESEAFAFTLHCPLDPAIQADDQPKLDSGAVGQSGI